MSLVNIATGVLLAKDLLGSKGTKSKATKSQSSRKGLGTFGKVVIALGGAYVANKLINSYTKSNVEDQAGTNTKDGRAANYAIRLYDAMFGGFFFGLGTDDEEIKTVAALIKAENLNDLVISKYRTLYSASLNTDLQKEGVFVAYYSIINGTAPTPTGGTGGTGGTGTRQLTVGATIYSYGGWIVSNINGVALRNTVAGEAWQITGFKTETIRGTTGVFVRVKKKDINLITEYKIFYKGLYFK